MTATCVGTDFRATINNAAEGRKVDVVIHKNKLVISCEISISTNVEHEAQNIKKCLKESYTRILFICSDKKRREKVEKKIKELHPDAPIDFLSPEDVVSTLERLDTGPATITSTVRGYKVKVTRQVLSANELAGRRSAIAEVIADWSGGINEWYRSALLQSCNRPPARLRIDR